MPLSPRSAVIPADCLWQSITTFWASTWALEPGTWVQILTFTFLRLSERQVDEGDNSTYFLGG